MKKYFAIFSLLIAMGLSSCHTQKSAVPESYGNSITSVKSLKPDTFTVAQMDSVVKVDKLPSYGKWNAASFKEDESLKAYEYRSLFDSRTGVVYTLKDLRDGRFVLRKRIVKTK